jgi:hypothetical protein
MTLESSLLPPSESFAAAANAPFPSFDFWHDEPFHEGVPMPVPVPLPAPAGTSLTGTPGLSSAVPPSGAGTGLHLPGPANEGLFVRDFSMIATTND